MGDAGCTRALWDVAVGILRLSRPVPPSPLGQKTKKARNRFLRSSVAGAGGDRQQGRAALSAKAVLLEQAAARTGSSVVTFRSSE